MNNQKHEFAVYANLTEIKDVNFLITHPERVEGSSLKPLITLSDEKVYHRIIRVLRLELNDKFILFDKIHNLSVQITEINKKNLTINILAVKKNIELKPNITMLVSMLKRESFEEAVYACVEMGASAILPVITQKVHKRTFDAHELTRFENIIISAAEQSKNFNFPELQKPILLEKLLPNLPQDSSRIYFDISGQKPDLVINRNLPGKPIPHSEFVEELSLFLMTGPEGDLNSQEKELLIFHNFIFCALTPTVLRAQTAVSLGLGIFRSIL